MKKLTISCLSLVVLSFLAGCASDRVESTTTTRETTMPSTMPSQTTTTTTKTYTK